jgi:hypothetical protein
MATLPSLSAPGMNPALARCLDREGLYYISQTSVFTCLVLLLALVIRLHLLMRHGVWANVIHRGRWNHWSSLQLFPLFLPPTIVRFDNITFVRSTRSQSPEFQRWSNQAFPIPPPSLPNASTSPVHVRSHPLRRCSDCLGACPGPARSRGMSASSCYLFIFSFPLYFFRVDVLILSSSNPSPMLIYPVTQHCTIITRHLEF